MRQRSSKLRRWLQLRRQLVAGFPRVPTTSPLHQEGAAAALPSIPQLSPDSLPEVTQWVGSSPLHHQPHLVDLPGGFTQGIKRRRDLLAFIYIHMQKDLKLGKQIYFRPNSRLASMYFKLRPHFGWPTAKS